MKNLSKIFEDPRFRLIFWSVFCVIILFRLIKAFSQGAFNNSGALIGLVIGTAIGAAYLFFRFGFKPKIKNDPAQVMRQMRKKWLTTPPDRVGIKEFLGTAEIYGVLMEENFEKFTATVLTSTAGDASLYTTGTFGVVGGVAHEGVKKTAKNFCLAGERFFQHCQKTVSFPYPGEKEVLFYILSREGIYTVSAKKDEIVSQGHLLFPLYMAGQDVLTQLRLIAQKQSH